MTDTKLNDKVNIDADKGVNTSAEAMDSLHKNYDDYLRLQKETVDSFSKAWALWMEGVENLNQELFARAQNNFEKNLSDSPTVDSVKDPQAFFTAQNEWFAKVAKEMVSTGAFISERTVNLTNRSLAPVHKQLSKNWDALSHPAMPR